jgi:membrane protein CcdC involved in cytochrome C biogenesis
LELIWKLLSALMASWLSENIDVPTLVALFYILHYTCLNGIYFHLEYRCVMP